MKLSQFCHVEATNILNIHYVPNIWHIPLSLRNQNAHHSILKQLNFLDLVFGSTFHHPSFSKYHQITKFVINFTLLWLNSLLHNAAGLGNQFGLRY
ncbi:hypothetical protein ERO13_D03G081750v2 [Gossypium hirsutum]|nr:hypothetical protein ERO13_D03G081750v2 [Gossypium hirsutum]